MGTALTVCVVVLVAVLAYTYFGYPVVIGLLAWLRPFRVHAPVAESDGGGVNNDSRLPLISVCLPVYNGASYLPAKIDSLLNQDYPADRVEILIYCDGCSDETEAVARRLAVSPEAGGRIQVFAESRRLGKPTGLNTLGPAARGELLLLNDVRQPLSPNALRALSAPLADPRVGGTTGNLVLAGGAGSGVYWRYETWIRRQESRFHGVVGMTGPIGMIRRADLRPLPRDLILDDVWIPMQLALAGKRFNFVGEAQAYDAAFENDREFQRKVRTLAGNYQLFARIPALLVPGVNPLWFETISHKILRLLAPWAMIALAATTVYGICCGSQAMPGSMTGSMMTGPAAASPTGGWLTALLIAQVVFYLTAALGKRAGKLGGVARTFVVLNVAAVVGLWRHLTGRQRVTW